MLAADCVVFVNWRDGLHVGGLLAPDLGEVEGLGAGAGVVGRLLQGDGRVVAVGAGPLEEDHREMVDSRCSPTQSPSRCVWRSSGTKPHDDLGVFDEFHGNSGVGMGSEESGLRHG